MHASPALSSLAALLLVALLPAQAPLDAAAVDALRELANRRVVTKAAAEQRQADAAAWLQQLGDRDLGELAVLRALACTFTGDQAAQRRGREQVLAFCREHATLPAAGFEEPVGLVVLFEFVKLADAGDWDGCRSGLPVLLRACRDHQSAFWLLGRRARDAHTDAGTAFLQQVVIPGVLDSHVLDDVERVNVLRRLYEVDYTGPRPFVHVAGPALDGQEVRTADARGQVLLVDYWATWCTPCLLALPQVAAVHRRFADQGLRVVGISIDDAADRERVAATVKELGLPFPVIFDGQGGKGPLPRANAVLAVPATFLIDRKGRVRWTNLDGDALAARVAELLAER